MKLSLRIPPLAVMAVAGFIGWIGTWLFPTLAGQFAARSWVAVGFVAGGVLLAILGVIAFRRARTTVNPLRPDAASKLVVSGIYRVTRNPMYLGFLFVLLGELAWLAHPSALFSVAAFVIYLNCFQIGPEEQTLRHRFGIEYSIYTARVRRWL